MSAISYTPCEAARQIGEDLIGTEDAPGIHIRLASQRILYLFNADGVTCRGPAAYAKVGILSGRAAYLMQRDVRPQDRYERIAVMEIDPEAWADFPEAKRRALVDHELCHLTRGKGGKLALRGHDVEEFTEILERHGLWRKDLAQFVRAGMSLPGHQVTFVFSPEEDDSPEEESGEDDESEEEEEAA